MIIPFRQGIIRGQHDAAGQMKFLQVVDDTTISLLANTTPLQLAFAQRDTDYLLEISDSVSEAWSSIDMNTKQYLYIDINVVTGAVTYGSSTLALKFGSTAPSSPKNNQMWFDTDTTAMYYYQASTQSWIECIRVMVGSVHSSAITSLATGTQVGLETSIDIGYILFDSDGNAIKKWKRDKTGLFYTSTDTFVVQMGKAASVKLDATLMAYESGEPIPAYSAVCFVEQNVLGLASSSSSIEAFGIVILDTNQGEVANVVPQGFVTNSEWEWTSPFNTPLFYDSTGELTVTIPQSGTIQKMGYIVDPTTIFINPRQQITIQ
jgi:hypothetical protein